MIHPSFAYVVTRVNGAQRVTTLRQALRLFATEAGQWDAHLSICRYRKDLRDYARQHDGRVRGYAGAGCADYLVFDLDADMPAESLGAALALANTLHARYDVPLDANRYSYSGGGGYHLELLTRLFGDVEPSEHVHLVLRHLAETIAREAGVLDVLDTQRYARLALLRFPGTQHPARPPAGRTYAWKTVLSWNELSMLRWETHDAFARAEPRPSPYDRRRAADTPVLPRLAEIYAAAVDAARERASRPPPEPARTREEPIDVTAVAAVLAPHYTERQRHAVALGFGGYCAKQGVRQEDAIAVVKKIAARDDDDGLKSIERVGSSYAALSEGDSVAGRSMLEGALDADTLEELARLIEPAEEWPEPIPIPSLPPVEAFTANMLPTVLRPWVEDVAERMQCPLDYPGVACMIALATIVGRRLAIRPKQQDDWTVVPNLWGEVIGRPGVLKTPAIREALRPIRRLEAEARRAFTDALEEYKTAKARYDDEVTVSRELRRQALREAAKAKTAKANSKTRTNAEAEPPAEPTEPTAPTRLRYMVGDTTVEKLGEILAENPNGLLLFRDELVGFWRTLDKKGHENDRGFYLETWDGLGDTSYDRIGRGSLYVPSTTLSIFGGITPGSLGAYLRAAEDGGSGDDGFVQRHQLAIWSDLPPSWKNVDRWPKSDARRNAYELFGKLAKLDPEAVGGQYDDNEDEYEPNRIPYVRFTTEARERFVAWRTELENLVRRSMDDNPSLAAHLAKYRSLIPSLALLVHLGNGDVGNVSLAALETALVWDRYLRSHAERIYAARTGTDQRCVHERMALERLLALAEAERTDRRLFQWARRWRGIEDMDDLTAVLKQLERRGWIRVRSRPRTGKPGRPAANRIDVFPHATSYTGLDTQNTHNSVGDSSEGNSEDIEYLDRHSTAARGNSKRPAPLSPSDADYDRLDRAAIQAETAPSNDRPELPA